MLLAWGLSNGVVCALQYMRNIGIPVPFVGKIRVFELFPVILAIICAWVLGIIVTSCEPPSAPVCARARPNPGASCWRQTHVLCSIAKRAPTCLRVLAAGAYDNSSPATQAACRTDQVSVLHHTNWIRFPYPGQWGAPTFSASGVFTMFAGATHGPYLHQLHCRQLTLAGCVITDSITCLQAPYLP